jgi:hypothetical protein
MILEPVLESPIENVEDLVGCRAIYRSVRIASENKPLFVWEDLAGQPQSEDRIPSMT